MPIYMKYDDIKGDVNAADRFDFSQLTTEPTAPAEERHISDLSIAEYLDTSNSKFDETDHGLLLPAVRLDDGLLLPAVQDDGLLLPAVQTDYGLLLPY